MKLYNTDGDLIAEFHYVPEGQHARAVAIAHAQELHLMYVDLKGADLAGASFAGMNLRRADFRGAKLDGADFSGCSLESAVLTDASCIDATFDGANLKYASFNGADVHGATFTGTRCLSLTEDQMLSADLRAIEVDLLRLLDHFDERVPVLLETLRAGKIDGSTYAGVHKCVVGTLAAAAGLTYPNFDDLCDEANPIERFSNEIHVGDTPETSPRVKMLETWITKWMINRGVFPEAAATAAPAYEYVDRVPPSPVDALRWIVNLAESRPGPDTCKEIGVFLEDEANELAKGLADDREVDTHSRNAVNDRIKKLRDCAAYLRLSAQPITKDKP